MCKEIEVSPIHPPKQTPENTENKQMSDLTNKDFKAVIINMFKGIHHYRSKESDSVCRSVMSDSL